MPDLQTVPSGYPELLESLKGRIRTSKMRAALAVSHELVLLYWSIGRDILAREKQEGWGARVVDRLAAESAGLYGIGLLACLCIPAIAQSPDHPKPRFEYSRSLWRTSDGLPEATVQAFAEAGDGQLWIATTGGLASFDGFHLYPWNAPRLQAVSAHSIFCLTTDRDGSLWAGTEGGGLLHIEHDQVRILSAGEGLTDGFVRSIYQDPHGVLWVGTDDGLFRMRGGPLQRVDDGVSIPRIAVHSIAGDREGNVWVGGSQLLRISPDGRTKVLGLPGLYSKSRVKSILQTADGTVWVGTVGGLQRLVHGKFESVPSIHATVRTLLETNDGTLWVGTIGDGLWTIQGGRPARMAIPNLLPSDTALSMLQDNNGQIWIGTQAGMLRLSHTPVGVVPLPRGGDPDFETVSGDSEGNVWVAAQQLFTIRGGVAKRLRFPRLEQMSIRNVFRARDGALWLGTDGSGAFRVDRHAIWHLSAPKELTNNFVRAFLQAEDGAIWIATDEGVSRIRGSEIRKYTEDAGLVYFSTRCLLQDRNGGIWIGTDRGISFWKDGAFQENALTAALKREKVWSILQDRQGTLWFGTRDHGLFRAREGQIVHLTAGQGLPSDSVYQLLQDRFGIFWMTGPDTIAAIAEQAMDIGTPSKAKPLSVAVYTMPFGADDAQMYGGRQPAGFLGPDDTVWFPTSKGVAHIKADGVLPHLPGPRSVITRFDEDGRNVAAQGPLEIPATVTRLGVRYGATLLTNQSGVHFRYRLEPLESAWNMSITDGWASYTNLAAGSYTFRLQAFDAARPDDVSEAAITFRKAPHFYQSWWFYTLAVLALLFVIWGVYRLRVGQIRNRFRAVLAERNRLAREMHDTVIQGCTSVSALLEAMASSRDPQLDRSLLEYAREQTRRTIDEARHAVWDMRHDEKEVDLLHALRTLADQTTREHGSSVTVHSEAADLRLRSSAAHEVLMTVREAVYNAVQHSGTDRIDMTAEERSDELTIRIADFGRGLRADASSQDGHFGLVGMRERMKRLGGHLEVNSAPGKGTVVVLSLRHASRTQAMSASWRSSEQG